MQNGCRGKMKSYLFQENCKTGDGWCDGIQFKYAYSMETGILRFGMIFLVIFTRQLNQIKIIVENFAFTLDCKVKNAKSIRRQIKIDELTNCFPFGNIYRSDSSMENGIRYI